MGHPVDKDLMNLVSAEVTNLNQDLEAIKKSSADEAKKITAAFQVVTDEISKFDKRITDIESRMEAERKEQLEKNEALSGAIGDISNSLTNIEKRQDTNEENIARLDERESVLETTVTSLKGEQDSLTSKVEGLEIEQNQLDSRLKALEESNINATANVEIFQVPSRNRCFCGRETELEAILTQLKNVENGCAETAICGLGGVGKTSLAVEFLWRKKENEEYPGGIFWISGENNDLFQISLNEMARQIGTLEKDFSNSLSGTLNWLRRCEKLWCLVVDNLDELEMSADMRKLLTGHWKQAAHGHIIITTRREATEIGEETGIEGNFCIELKCLTDEEGIQFLRMRTGAAGENDSEIRELVQELGGLPLALDQAAAYIKCLHQPIKEYVKKYRKQKLLLLKKKKARVLVENTSPERLAIHTTWLLNFDHISQISKEMELGEIPTLVMKVSAFLGPDDIPYEVINEGLNKVDDTDLCDQAEIVSLLTKFSLFQRYGTHSFSVHRLVQEVIRSDMEREQTELGVLTCAGRVLHHALANTRSPAEVCESFVEDAVFSVENPPSLQLWGKLASHATYLQEHLRSFSAKHQQWVPTLLYAEETLHIFNEAAIFFSVSQENVKAQALQKMKLEFLVNLERPSSVEGPSLPNYFIDVPLKDRDHKLISCCMREPEHDNMTEANFSQNEKEEEAVKLREKGNLAIKRNRFEEALDLYSSAIALSSGDYRLFCNRALCHLKLGQPQNALDDCQKCLSLEPYYNKALVRKAWALRELQVKSGSSQLKGQTQAALAMAVHFDPNLCLDRKLREMFPEVTELRPIEVANETQLAFALITAQGNGTLLLHEGEYSLPFFVILTDLQIVGLGPRTIVICKENCSVNGARCYIENIVFPRGNTALICQGKKGALHVNQCEISGGETSCEDYPECNGGPGCIAASLGKPVCDRTHKFGEAMSISGIGGHSGVQSVDGSSTLIENCVIRDCGGGGALVVGKGSRLLIRKCDVYQNHQAGLEAREGGELIASENRIFDSGFHGILIGPGAGECDINGNKIFENAREGILAVQNKTKIVIRNNHIHHNRPFGLSLDFNSQLVISDNKIFDNGFWGILAKTRTSAHIARNVLSGNKCGGIFIGVNFSGRVHLESNVVRDHSGPWLEYQRIKDSFLVDSSFFAEYDSKSIFYLPPGEKNEFYSNPPILNGNKEFNNQEGTYHPREVGERLYSGCTYCRRSRNEVERLMMCSNCHIASYCCKECQRKHRPTHKALCFALKGRYSVTVDTIPLVNSDGSTCSARFFGTHLKGTGKGPKLNRDTHQKFIIKIQTQSLNSHPLQLLSAYDKSLTIDCRIQSPEIFNVIMECGVLGALNKFTSKKAFFWAMFAEHGEKLTVFLEHLAPYQEW